jgi:hypothetical protein
MDDPSQEERRTGAKMGSSWSTQLDLPAREIARLYEDHGTSEQYHSEMKSELDLERLPDGKWIEPGEAGSRKVPSWELESAEFSLAPGGASGGRTWSRLGVGEA